MKNLFIISMLRGIAYSQCDANGDGDLNLLDVIEEEIRIKKTIN